MGRGDGTAVPGGEQYRQTISGENRTNAVHLARNGGIVAGNRSVGRGRKDAVTVPVEIRDVLAMNLMQPCGLGGQTRREPQPEPVFGHRSRRVTDMAREIQ
jgi:hypothetical protein